jgi:hypothetical protein
MPNRQVKVMVVTEGPKAEKVSKDGIREIKRHILSPANIFMYPFLYAILNGKFRPDGQADKEPSTAYWTHVRKCFMQGENREVLNRCSRHYLEDEMKFVRPSLIITLERIRLRAVSLVFVAYRFEEA